jgi:hypothetical protein
MEAIMLRQILIVLICTTLLLSGCVSTKPNTAALKSMKKVALITLNLDRVGKGPNNDPVLKNVAGFADTVYRQELEKISQWQVVKAPGISELERHFAKIKSSKIAKQVLLEMADQNRLDVNLNNEKIAKLTLAAFSGNQDAMAQMKNEIVSDTLELLQNDLDEIRDELVWPKSKAGIPVWLVNSGKSKGRMAALREITKKVIEDYRVQTGLDGVILVHQASQLGTPGDIRVIVQDNRILSSIKVNPAIFVLAAGSEIALYEGSNRLDDLAPMKLAMPVYAGKKVGGTIKYPKINLADPAGKGQEGYYILVSDTAKDLIGDVKKILAQ